MKNNTLKTINAKINEVNERMEVINVDMLIKSTIKNLLDAKVAAVDAHNSMNEADEDEYFDLCYVCECKMDLCGLYVEKLYTILEGNTNITDIETYLLDVYQFELFDTSLIFNYMK